MLTKSFGYFPVALFIATLISIGIALAISGIHAIQHQSFDLQWKSGGGISVPGVNLQNQKMAGVLAFRGIDAIRFGIGLIASGSMFVIWGIGQIVLIFKKPSELADNKRRFANPSRLTIILGWPSLTCLLLSVGCFFPPWRIEAAPLYGVAFVPLLLALRLEDMQRRRYARMFFPSVIATAIIVAPFRQDISFAMLAGFFVFIGLLFHLALLVPKVGKMLDASDP